MPGTETKNTKTPSYKYEGFKSVDNMLLKKNKRRFIFSIINIVVFYVVITLFLDNFRDKTPVWFVWILIVFHLISYILIFAIARSRSITLGLNNVIASIVFIALAILGKISDWDLYSKNINNLESVLGKTNNWELIIIPVVVVVMIIWSSTSKKIPS